ADRPAAPDRHRNDEAAKFCRLPSAPGGNQRARRVSARSSRCPGMQMLREAALAGQLADDFPGELARRRVGILPPVHRRDGDRDGVRELLLGQSELAPKSADHVAGVDVHAMRLHCDVLREGATRVPRRIGRGREAAFETDAACARRSAMRRGVAGTLLLGALLLWAPRAWTADASSPEDVLKRYLQAVKDEKFDQVYDLVSQAMRQGKDKEAYVKEQKAMMAYADVKIFDFTVYPGKVEGDKAQVPNILESQDRFVNTLGLTDYELYTLVRENGAWKVDSQLLLEPAEQPKWFPKGPKPKEPSPH